MEVITIASRKGGNAKTTTAQQLAAGLALKGFRVLAVDLDSQGNLTSATDVPKEDPTAADVLTGTPAADAIRSGVLYDIIPASVALTAIEDDIKKKPAALAQALEPIRSKYDYIVIDTATGINPELINALMASTGVIIPVQAEVFGIGDGLPQLIEIIRTVQKRNPALKLKGFLLTRYKPRSKTAQNIAEQVQTIADKIGTKVYKNPIRECGKISDAQARGLDVFTYSRTSNAAKDYAVMIAELLKEE